MRVLFDTNVLVAAFLTEGLCWKLLIRANRKEFSLFTCPYILTELKKTLSSKFDFSMPEVRKVASLIKEIAEVVEYEKQGIKVEGVCRDEKDDAVLASALASKADYLVTGDMDLLTLKQYKAIKIISPRDFELLLIGSD